MKITCRRFEYSDTYTISRLYVDGVYECYVLEDKVRPVGVKVQDQTAIPAGVYSVVIDFSNHFQKLLPHILDVPMFEGVRIHSGNTSADTEGCLIVGKIWGGKDGVSMSRVAFTDLYIKMESAVHLGQKINLEIINTNE